MMDYLIYFFIFFIFLILIIYGIPFKRLNFNSQIANIQREVVRENFETSTNQEVKQGASTFYGWGLPEGKDESSVCKKTTEPPVTKAPHPPEPCTGKKCVEGNPTYIENDYYIYPEKDVVHEKSDCSKCEAYNCKGIDKYVLKSSVPPCPDLSNYAPKSMVKTCPDMSQYIRKSEIPPCPQCPDLSNYVRKSEIPVCPPPVVCPECPVCPPTYKNIQDDPRFGAWLQKYEAKIEGKIDKNYIPKSQCEKITNEAYNEGMENGKRIAYKKIAEKSAKNCPVPEEEYKRPTITTTTLEPLPVPTTTSLPTTTDVPATTMMPTTTIPPTTTTMMPTTTTMMPTTTTMMPTTTTMMPTTTTMMPTMEEETSNITTTFEPLTTINPTKTNGECDEEEFLPGYDNISLGTRSICKKKLPPNGCKLKQKKFPMGSGLFMTGPVSPFNS